jgi:putative spermidine/putrescine transport system permease protein
MPVVLSPMIIPSIVTAVAMFLVFSKLGLTETRLGLILAHTVIALPLVIVSVLAALQRTDRSLELSARTLGAGPFRAFYTITLPLILPGVLTGAVFAFIASFDELVIAMFITGTKIVTLPKRMWDGIQYEIDPTSSAASTFIVLFTSVLVLVVGQISRWLARDRNASVGGKSLLNDRLAGLSLPEKPEGFSK